MAWEEVGRERSQMLYAVVALIAFVAGGISLLGLIHWASDDHDDSRAHWRRSKHF
jgi:hypothetical protein